MSSVLQQTLRGLCFDTGWCYAVFWKLKRQARPVLTWEDAFYGSKADVKNASPSTATISGFGQQMSAGLADMEDPIALSVSKMSYHVYSVGEGIIGRIAFTNKHQWVFSSNDKGAVTDGVSTKKANLRMQPEKYPSGWDQQFAAGIKTIAVIAVPQGVVQLGSARVISEDLKLIGHVKALFGTLQNVPGAFLSDLVTEVQRGRVHTVYPIALPAPQLSLARTASLPATLTMTPSSPAPLTMTPSSPANMNLSTASVGRLPKLLAAQQPILAHAHSMPSPSVLGFSGGVSYFQNSPLDNSVLESLSNPSFCTLQPLCTRAGLEDIQCVKMGTVPGVKPPTDVPVTSGMKVNTPPQTGVTRKFSISSTASSVALPFATSTPFSQGVHSPYSTDSSVTGGKGVTVEEPDQLRANCSPRTGVIRYLPLNSKASPSATPVATGAVFLQAIHSPYSVNSDGTGGKGDVEDFEQPKAYPPPRTGVIGHLSLNKPAVTGASFPQTVHSSYSVHSAIPVDKQMNPPPQTGVIRDLSLSFKASPITIPAATGASVSQAVHSPYIKSSVSRDNDVRVVASEQSRADHPFQKGIIKHLSLNSKASPIVVCTAGTSFLQTVHSPCSVSSAATRRKGVNVVPSVGESEQWRAQSKAASRMENSWPVSRKHILAAAESCNVKSFMDSPNISLHMPGEDSLTMVGSWLENTQNMSCGASPVKQIPVSARLLPEQSGGRTFSLGEGLSVEGLQLDSSRHSEISQQLLGCRSSTESGQTRHIRTMTKVQQSDQGSHMVNFAQVTSGCASNQLAKGSPKLDRPLPPVEISSLVCRPPSESNHRSARSSFLQSEHLEVNSTPKGVYQIDKSSFDSSEPSGSNLVSCSNTGGFPLRISCTKTQDLHERDSGSTSARVNSFPNEVITGESSHLTAQMSDLLELAQRFENADGEDHQHLTSVNVDSHQSFSPNLFDDCFEGMQSLKPIFQSPDRQPVGDSGPTDYSVHNLFTSELDDFDEFFTSLNKAESKGSLSVQPETISDTRGNSEVSGYLNSDSYDLTLKEKEKFTNIISCSNTAYRVASAANQPLPHWVASEATLPGKEVANLGKGLQVDRFVNSRIHPEKCMPSSRMDGDKYMSCQEMATLLPPPSRQHETRKKGKKRRWPGKNDVTLRFKGRQKMQERIQELRTIVPDGARCGIDTLLERALEYASALQTAPQDSGKGAPCANLQIGTEISEASTSFDVSWLVDIGAQERVCPVLVESLSQPGQMLVEMLCHEHAIFLKIADVLKRLGFTILKGVMEARDNSIWARFVIEGPREIHRAQVLWSLMHLLGAHTEC